MAKKNAQKIAKNIFYAKKKRWDVAGDRPKYTDFLADKQG
jgi:hypothetical protein